MEQELIMRLPQQFSSAKIIITDKSGKTLKEINVSGSGKGSLNVDASNLSVGSYQYSLYIKWKIDEYKTDGTSQIISN